ncbi:MAG: hypothetical protein GEU79_14665 [Acidimicrobiia bacterium]|nr:hypothetical protein [Acidimicrobiia bacterium]
MEAGQPETTNQPGTTHRTDGHSGVISLFPTPGTESSCRFQIGDFTLSSCEDAGDWELNDEIVDTHMAIARVIGGISLGKPIPSVGGPSSQVQVGRMRPIHRRLLRSIPLGEWVNFGAGVWCSHDGNRLSIALAPTEVHADLP